MQERAFGRRLAALRSLRVRDVRLHVPDVKNRVTGKSMGEQGTVTLLEN